MYVIASEAKQSQGHMKRDCFVAALLAMTQKMIFKELSPTPTRLKTGFHTSKEQRERK